MHGDSVYRSLAWLPLCASGIGLATILITYMLAVGHGHIQPVLPYISDTGIEYPESSVFSLGMDIQALMLMLIVYISYLLIGQFSYRYGGDDMGKNGQRLTRANRVGLVVGFIAATGLAILANFPEDENLPIHLMGAFFCFTFGVAYSFIHSWLSFQTCPEFNSPCVCFLQLTLAVISALMMLLCILFGGVLRWDADEDNPQPFLRKISAVFEWTLVVTLDLYFATFALEFRRLRISHTFHHYKRGSWVEFIPFTGNRGRSGSTGHSSEDSGSTRSSSYLANNTNYIVHRSDNSNCCQHNHQITPQPYCQRGNQTSQYNICQHNNKTSLQKVGQGISYEAPYLGVRQNKTMDNQNMWSCNNKTTSQQGICCKHQNGTSHVLHVGERCSKGGWATTV